MPRIENYALMVGEEGSERLRLLNLTHNPDTLNFIHELGSLQGKTILDIGCGTGIMTAELAKLVGHEGQVFAVDISYDQLNLAKENIMKLGLKNVTFFTESASNLTQIFGFNFFDFIYCRFLLIHLQDREEVVKILCGLLKNGGQLFCEEASSVDAMFCFPPHAAFERWTQAVNDQISLYKSDFTFGERLPSFFQKNNLKELKVHVRQAILRSEQLKDQLWLGLEEIRPILVKEKLTTHEALDDDIRHLKALSKDEDVVIGLFQYTQICGKRMDHP